MDSGKLSLILSNMPSHWNKDPESNIYKLVKSISDEFEEFNQQLDVVDMSIGIDGSYDFDLDRRWGALLNIPRLYGEDDIPYRNRIKLSITRMIGGTSDALRFAVSNILSNINHTDVSKYISVTDAWLYTGSAVVDKSYSNAICTIDITHIDSITESVMSEINYAISEVKASGVNVYIIFYTSDDERTSIVNNSDYNMTENIFEIILPDGFTSNSSLTNGMDVTPDGIFHADINAVEDNNDIVSVTPDADEVYDVFKIDSSVTNIDTANDTLYTMLFDDMDRTSIIDTQDDDIPLNTQQDNDDTINQVIDGGDDDAFISNFGLTNVSVISDGTESTIICTDDSNDDDISITPDDDDEVYEIFKVDSSMTNVDTANGTLYTMLFDDGDNISIVDIQDEDISLDTQQDDNDIISDAIDGDDVFISNLGLTNISVISDGTESTMICTDESGMDRIIQDGQPDIIINY